MIINPRYRIKKRPLISRVEVLRNRWQNMLRKNEDANERYLSDTRMRNSTSGLHAGCWFIKFKGPTNAKVPSVTVYIYGRFESGLFPTDSSLLISSSNVNTSTPAGASSTVDVSSSAGASSAVDISVIIDTSSLAGSSAVNSVLALSSGSAFGLSSVFCVSESLFT